jgi:hypothetical protein
MNIVHGKQRKILAPALVAALIAVAVMSLGCMWAPGLSQVRRDLERQLPGARFEKDVELSMGPVSLAFARLFTNMVPDARQASGYLKDVSRIELAVYDADHIPSPKGVKMPRRLQQLVTNEDWEMAVRIRDKGELGWILYRTDDERIKELYVVLLNQDELLMVRAEGNLERLVARALSETGTMKGISSGGLTMNNS